MSAPTRMAEPRYLVLVPDDIDPAAVVVHWGDLACGTRRRWDSRDQSTFDAGDVTCVACLSWHEAGTCHLSEWSCTHCETAAERMGP